MSQNNNNIQTEFDSAREREKGRDRNEDNQKTLCLLTNRFKYTSMNGQEWERE